MATARIQSRGQVTLPVDIREAAGLHTGDSVTFRVVGPGRVEVSSIPRMTLEQIIEEFGIDGPIDWDEIRKAAQQDAADEVIRKLELLGS